MSRSDERAFRKRMGEHVRSLRRVRGLTQDRLAEICEVSADTVRRLEAGSFSPSITTLRAVSDGFGLSLATFFDSLDLGERIVEREIADLVAGRPRSDLTVVVAVLRELLDALDRQRRVERDASSVE